jgi:hypothetical protein
VFFLEQTQQKPDEAQKGLRQYYEKISPQVYSQEGIDRIIITNNTVATNMVRKVPNFKRVPIYFFDANNKKVPLKDELGNVVVDDEGAVKYVISDWEFVQDGYKAIAVQCPASEPFTPDMTGTWLDDELTKGVTELGLYYNYLQRQQMVSDEDYSFELHQLVNDINFFLLPRKSFMGGSVSAVKTFRTIEEGTQKTITGEMQKKGGLFSGINSALWGKSGGQTQMQQGGQNKPFYV